MTYGCIGGRKIYKQEVKLFFLFKGLLNVIDKAGDLVSSGFSFAEASLLGWEKLFHYWGEAGEDDVFHQLICEAE